MKRTSCLIDAEKSTLWGKRIAEANADAEADAESEAEATLRSIAFESGFRLLVTLMNSPSGFRKNHEILSMKKID